MSYSLCLPSGMHLQNKPGASISLNMENPIFDPQRTDRTWAFPLTTERSPHNEMALSANRADSVSVGLKISGVTLYIDGIPFETGVLKVTKLSRTTISLNFGSYAIDFASRAEAVKLRDLDLSVTVATPFSPVIQLETRRNSPIGIYKLWIRINGIDYIRDYSIPATWINAINADHPGLFTLVQEDGLAHLFTLNTIPGISALDIDFQPGPDYVDSTTTFYVFASLIDLNYQSEALRIVAAYQSLDAQADNILFRLPTIYTTGFYDDKNPGFDGIMNSYDSESGGYTFQPFYLLDEIVKWDDALLPQPRVASLIEAALSRMGYTVLGSLQRDAELRELLIWNNHDLNIRMTDLGPTTSGLFVSTEEFLENAFIVPRPTFNLADHAPDLTALQLVLLFAETFAHIITPEADQVTFTPIKDLLRAAPEDYTDKIDTDYSVSFSDATTPILDYNRQGDENVFPGQLERITLPGTGDQKVYTLPVFSTFEQVRDDGGVRKRLPVVSDEGRNQTLDLGNEPRLRFFFNRGIQPAITPDQTYPQASHSLQGSGNYSMSWEGPGGLYETWWKELIQLLQYGRPFTVPCRLTISDLLEIRKWRNVRKYIRIDDATFVGVIRSVKVKVSDRGIHIANVTFQMEPS